MASSNESWTTRGKSFSASRGRGNRTRGGGGGRYRQNNNNNSGRIRQLTKTFKNDATFALRAFSKIQENRSNPARANRDYLSSSKRLLKFWDKAYYSKDLKRYFTVRVDIARNQFGFERKMARKLLDCLNEEDEKYLEETGDLFQQENLTLMSYLFLFHLLWFCKEQIIYFCDANKTNFTLFFTTISDDDASSSADQQSKGSSTRTVHSERFHPFVRALGLDLERLLNYDGSLQEEKKLNQEYNAWKWYYIDDSPDYDISSVVSRDDLVLHVHSVGSVLPQGDSPTPEKEAQSSTTDLSDTPEKQSNSSGSSTGKAAVQSNGSSTDESSNSNTTTDSSDTSLQEKQQPVKWRWERFESRLIDQQLITPKDRRRGVVEYLRKQFSTKPLQCPGLDDNVGQVLYFFISAVCNPGVTSSVNKQVEQIKKLLKTFPGLVHLPKRLLRFMEDVDRPHVEALRQKKQLEQSQTTFDLPPPELQELKAVSGKRCFQHEIAALKRLLTDYGSFLDALESEYPLPDYQSKKS